VGEIVLRTEDLVHTYSTGVTALKGVNLAVQRNEVVSIIGQNGSGKTTLVRHYNGLLRPGSGKVFVEGEDTAGKSVSFMSRKVGYVFQNPNHQIFCTTVREELEVAPKNYGFDGRKMNDAVDRIVDMMNLESLLFSHPLTLDYTTKKIVTIASVLAYSPEVLILDEPTGGLDQAGREMLTRIIKLTRDEGHTLIMISHDMDYVAENSLRIVVMSEGQVIRDDVPGRIFNDPEIMRRAQIEPPQITQLDMAITTDDNPCLCVDEFVKKYRSQINS
jgi:energy-coupling factor transport system ATP-binding protein